MAEFYSNAARIIEKVLQKKGTPKALVIENSRIRNKKKLYALVCEAIKYKAVTDKLLEDTKLFSKEKQLKYPMALVLVYDFLFGRGLQVGGQLKQVINRNKTSLQAALAKMKVKAKVVKNEELLPQNILEQQEMKIPRYVRVNTLKISTPDVIAWFSGNGFKLLGTQQEMAQMASGTFLVDEHIPDVLVFPPGTDLHDNILYKEGKIILQDKASCFPAFVLNPPAGSVVIDACAAPGNKTSHLAAIMDNTGKIFAFDISDKRISTMKKLLDRAGAKIIEAKHEDFLKVDPSDPVYTNVQYILVDPSCSGSGIINRLDYVTCDKNNMDAKEKQRVYSLAQFQEKALSHAMNFPNVKKVVYSTCSLHNVENEEVVIKCLERFHEKFELKKALPNWPHRGHPLFHEASKCVRASPKEGSTSGFFLALFEARNSEETPETARRNKGKKIENDINESKSSPPKKQHVCSVNSKETFTREGRGWDSCVANTTITETYLKRRKRTYVADNIASSQAQKKRIKLRRTHRRCSNEEFEKKLKLLEKKKLRTGRKTDN